MWPIMEPAEHLVGVDFAGPSKGNSQRKKILAIWATRITETDYFVSSSGPNERLFDNYLGPGWTVQELIDELSKNKVRVLAADFPFSLPAELLVSAFFAWKLGVSTPILTWERLLAVVGSRLSLTDPIDFSPFKPWRDKGHWKSRLTDIATAAQPPLKDKFQSLFQMTILGSALLSALRPHYTVSPFERPSAHEVIEIYPSGSVRALGAVYRKREPLRAINALVDECLKRGIKLEIDGDVLDVCVSYDSGKRSPDHDAADALVAVCTAILHREGFTEVAIREMATESQQEEGAIYVPVRRRASRRSPSRAA